jgi:hypothetical protein
MVVLHLQVSADAPALESPKIASNLNMLQEILNYNWTSRVSKNNVPIANNQDETPMSSHPRTYYVRQTPNSQAVFPTFEVPGIDLSRTIILNIPETHGA